MLAPQDLEDELESDLNFLCPSLGKFEDDKETGQSVFARTKATLGEPDPARFLFEGGAVPAHGSLALRGALGMSLS